MPLTQELGVGEGEKNIISQTANYSFCTSFCPLIKTGLATLRYTVRCFNTRQSFWIINRSGRQFYLFSCLDLLGPAALFPLLVDSGLLPGSSHKLLASTVSRHTKTQMWRRQCAFSSLFTKPNGRHGGYNSFLPVRYFDDVVCELHALEGHGLPLHTSARTVNKSLQMWQTNDLRFVKTTSIMLSRKK